MATPDPKLDAMTETALKSLKDIANPPSVSWFPQTWGWAVLGVILIAFFAAWAILSIRRYRANRYRREALFELETIEQAMLDPERRANGMRALAELLKRVALHDWPREEVAGLTGASWRGFLTHNGPDGDGQVLSTVLADFEYRDDSFLKLLPSNLTADLVSSARRWIGGHRVPA